MPKIVDHDIYREEMLEKCFHLFSRKGYSNTTMRELAVEIGVSTGTLYHYFPTKEKVLGELIAWAGEKNVGDYISRITSTDSIRKRFKLIVDFWKESGEFYQNLMLLVIDLQRNTSVEHYEKVYSFFLDRYSDSMSDKLNISLQFAQSIFIHFLGIVFHSLATPDKKEYSRQIELFSRLVEPLIVDVSENIDLAVEKTRDNIVTMLMKNPGPRGDAVFQRKILI
ncbi:MAG: TetR/AcrR family transcriptional regulator [Spirochaetes bacterium]|jgi:AcrR family transcriptional regulator|nr:TetR/AcrR family transcriptional regulator [Spirochaetota bacterium]